MSPTNASSTTPAVSLYRDARKSVEEAGFHDEIRWQENVSLASVTEQQLLRETAWVILSCGMKESVVRSKFPLVSEAFFEWTNVSAIADKCEACRARALRAFNHERKIDSIISFALLLEFESFEHVKSEIENGGAEYLRTLPFVGPITCYHLAKNLGLDVVKPDRHLQRIARTFGYSRPYDLCSEISEAVGERLSVIDIVLWRFATLHANYLDILSTYTVCR